VSHPEKSAALRSQSEQRRRIRKKFVAAWQRALKGQHPPVLDARQAVLESEAWWKDWSARCTYHGPHRDFVLRSLITLKALTYMPTCGIVAAPTTSLPEQIGGVSNRA